MSLAPYIIRLIRTYSLADWCTRS